MCLAVAVSTFVLAWFGLRLQAHGVAINWPAAGLFVGLLLVTHGRVRIAATVGIVIGLAAGNVLAQRTLLPSFVFMTANLMQAVSLTWLLERVFGRPFVLRGARDIVGFIAFATVTVASTALVVANALDWVGHAPGTMVSQFWWTWLASHLSGILAVTPLTLLAAQILGLPDTNGFWGVRKSGMSVRQRLAFLAAVPTIPLYIVAIAAIMHIAETGRESQQVAIHQSARSLANAIDVYVSKHVTLAQALARSPAMADSDLAALEAESRRMIDATGDRYTWLVVADPGGRELLDLATNSPIPLPLRSLAMQSARQRAFETGKPTISYVFAGPMSEDWVVTIDVPVYQNGQPFRSVVLALPASAIQAMVEARPAPADWLIGIIDTDGRLIARLPNGSYTGRLASASWRAVKDHEGIFRTISLDTEPVVTASVPLETGWTAGVAVKESDMMSSAWFTARWAALLSGVFAFLAAVLSYNIALRISEPIDRLGREASALVQGRPAAFATSLPDLEAVWSQLESAVADRKRIEGRLRDSEERLAMALEAGHIGVHDYNPVTGQVQWDAMIRALRGIGPDEAITMETFRSGVHPEDLPAVEAAMASALDPAGTGVWAMEYRIINRKTRAVRWVATAARATFENGRAVRLVGTVRDITRRKENERQIGILVREVNHRSKNILATVQAIARQTATRDSPALAENFARRIQSLAVSHDLLLEANWDGVRFDRLVRSQLAPFRQAETISISGPTVMLSAQAAQTLGMILHELATNASKYGALSTPGGRVDLAWSLAEGPSGRRFIVSWSETGGPPVQKPERRGFGTTILEDVARFSLDGTVGLIYREEGLEWRLDAPEDAVLVSTIRADDVEQA